MAATAACSRATRTHSQLGYVRGDGLQLTHFDDLLRQYEGPPSPCSSLSLLSVGGGGGLIFPPVGYVCLHSFVGFLRHRSEHVSLGEYAIEVYVCRMRDATRRRVDDY